MNLPALETTQCHSRMIPSHSGSLTRQPEPGSRLDITENWGWKRLTCSGRRGGAGTAAGVLVS
ncbi:hypothetical protein B0I73DRAFT_158717 [Yarrowia lipolytica]|uniref:YALI0E09735p n=2 Tax=Yarrowia lipolytica TaxID=4952 RepID=Q6C6G5_YARLI|nr:YALI0E09735p [Yarrowia lipolytica CLIB122]RDW26968.1 hypothetical protein B0I71DRAFT_145889 [Yarrowia lipolytica]RDW40171.1 hypothetical protein B0I73DRAFT_158717 [Yarrowia lipolytica]CAG79338.1 YALI0E09735p [Yarrowia lipolytica CLIB122]|eukprot:XP_503747.1 YALI0E09735p [Yarrowia lipolytica CLIB122]